LTYCSITRQAWQRELEKVVVLVCWEGNTRSTCGEDVAEGL